MKFVLRLAVPATAFCAVTARAAEEAPRLDPANTAWMLTATVLVLFMTLPGLALFYGGLVRTKNVLSVLMQCFAIAAIVSLLWVAFGYSLAFGDGGTMNAWLGGLDKVFLAGVTVDGVKGTIPETVFAMFQMTFAIITPALIVGGFAERMRFSAMLLFSVAWLVLVYLPVAHWVWGDGWLARLGVMDYAGGTVVHINAGVAALVAALVLGRRRGFPETPMPPHNLTMTVTGASMLWVGWFGFNAGSALAADGTAGMTMLVTHIGAAAGSVAWMLSEWVRFGKPSVLGIVTGMVAGLGTITPASGFVGPLGALVIGGTAGVVCFIATNHMKRRLRIDDSLDVFPVHGVGGILGTLATGLFAAKELGGVGYAAGTSIGSQVLTQLAGVVAVFVWCAVVTWVLFRLVDLAVGIRVSAEHETEGLDVVLHNETGYNL
ncbi:ammonium transporter [Sulfurifustis variabilis]|uniref:Ammonium transporter n=1 Tax=Sulfurifustis variabilis TaxID=1675686 RepID=A0A1B4VAN1_9GAMM|nr:ammonium transporter [Sulfurifustis variabilis]BAU47111.1 ammonium transporter [Sulfurifustis variabilis]